MKKLKLLGLFAGGCAVGAIAISCYWMYVLSQMTVSREVDFAAQSAFRAEWLAELRLGNTENAIKSMETAMDGDLFAIHQWEGTAFPDAKVRKARDKWLVSAKVYHESFPVHGEDAEVASGVNVLLAKIPGRNPKSTCKSGICTLDDLRLAKLNSKTNSP